MGRLNGKTALVVGAAGKDNMAQVIARRLTAEGARVAVAGRKADALSAFADEIGGVAVACDMTDQQSINMAVSDTEAALGGVDIAINATGWGLLKPFLETTQDDLDAMYALQLRGLGGGRQVPGDPRTAYSHVYGAPGISGVTILER